MVSDWGREFEKELKKKVVWEGEKKGREEKAVKKVGKEGKRSYPGNERVRMRRTWRRLKRKKKKVL